VQRRVIGVRASRHQERRVVRTRADPKSLRCARDDGRDTATEAFDSNP
jgi:hypothetical protein